MSDSPILRAQDGGVLTLTINRPRKLNALDAEVIADLDQAFRDVAEDDTVRSVVLTGAGDKAFVAGADIGELRALEPAAARDFLLLGHTLMNRIERLGKPVIAAINGYALGGGCELALACTIRIASDTARLGLPEVNLGLLPGYGGTQRLVRQVGRGRALHLMLTGDPVDADQALAMGLVTEVVPQAELAAHAGKLAGRLAAGAPLAQKAILEAVHAGADLALEEGLALEIDQFAAVCATEDMREGTGAFLDKRRPEFKGA